MNELSVDRSRQFQLYSLSSRPMARSPLALADSDEDDERRIRFGASSMSYNHHFSQREDTKYHHLPPNAQPTPSPLFRRRVWRCIYTAIVTAAVGLMVFNGGDSIFGFNGLGAPVSMPVLDTADIPVMDSKPPTPRRQAYAQQGRFEEPDVRRRGETAVESSAQSEGEDARPAKRASASASDSIPDSELDEELMALRNEKSASASKASKGVTGQDHESTEDAIPGDSHDAVTGSAPKVRTVDRTMVDHEHGPLDLDAAPGATKDTKEPAPPTAAQKALKEVHEHSKSLKGNLLQEDEPEVVGDHRSAAAKKAALAADAAREDETEADADKPSKPSRIVSKADTSGKLSGGAADDLDAGDSVSASGSASRSVLSKAGSKARDSDDELAAPESRSKSSTSDQTVVDGPASEESSHSSSSDPDTPVSSKSSISKKTASKSKDDEEPMLSIAVPKTSEPSGPSAASAAQATGEDGKSGSSEGSEAPSRLGDMAKEAESGVVASEGEAA